ncbi:MAG TPA: diadenylate cyclase CdaA [Bryobacteraceae bacterium]|nr:diadenylate cyclase CdaA [Bryobacteraceae bacterium]
MPGMLNSIAAQLRIIAPKLTPTAIVDILAVAFLIYQCLAIVRGRRAARILVGLSILVVVYSIAVWAKLELLRSVLAAAAPYSAIALIVMFQSELRRALARIGRSRWLGLGRQLESREMVDDVILAIEQMAEWKWGAIIVVERESGLRTFVESGVALDAAVSRELLCSIFQPGGALHDGAVIIQGDRVAAAACFLPLTMNPALQRHLGTRHRAAIGVTEETDAIAIVVSEESRQISIAARGELEADVSLERVRERLSNASIRNHDRQPQSDRDWVEQ